MVNGGQETYKQVNQRWINGKNFRLYLKVVIIINSDVESLFDYDYTSGTSETQNSPNKIKDQTLQTSPDLAH